MRRYRTEIVIPPDRYIALHLPAHLPQGRATVTILVEEPDPADLDAGLAELETDRQDIEWWDEFDGPDDEDEDTSLKVRSPSTRG